MITLQQTIARRKVVYFVILKAVEAIPSHQYNIRMVCIYYIVPHKFCIYWMLEIQNSRAARLLVFSNINKYYAKKCESYPRYGVRHEEDVIFVFSMC